MKNNDESEKKMMISDTNTESFLSYMKRMRQHYKSIASDNSKPYFDDVEVDASRYGFLTSDTDSHENNTSKDKKNESKPTEITTINLFDSNDIPTNKIIKEKKSFFITKIIKAILP